VDLLLFIAPAFLRTILPAPSGALISTQRLATSVRKPHAAPCLKRTDNENFYGDRTKFNPGAEKIYHEL